MLLDTTVLIDVLRGRPAVGRLHALRASGERPYICAINAEEVQRGARAGEESAVTALLGALWCAPLNTVTGAMAGTWRREYAQRGITLDQSDCLIAAAALGVGARLVTGNPKHFPMPEVLVDHWPVGE